MNEWQEHGKPISHVHTLSASELLDKLERYVVLDVREPSEWHKEGTIEGAKRIFFGDISEKADLLDRNKRYAVICSVGNRSSIAASILKKKGFVGVGNVLGGMTAWENMGYPTTKK
jgi:hydroxyacylglutathione hydrolase